jgi:hypothetical protein
MLRLLKKLPMLAVPLIALAVYAWLKPEVIPVPQIQSYVSYLKENPARIYESIPVEKEQVLGITDKIASFKIKLPDNLPVEGLPEEVVVDDLTKSILEGISALPKDQAKKVKVDICSDVINDAVATLSSQVKN